MQIYCRQCGEAIKAENINIDKTMAKCDSCNTVFSFVDMFENIEPKATRATKSKQEYFVPVPKPDRIRHHEENGVLRLERSWYSSGILGLLFFAIFWNGIIFGVFVPASFSDMGIFTLIFLLPFMAVGIGVGYLSLVMLLNRSVIQVNKREIHVVHLPLPVPNGNTKLEMSRVTQFFVKLDNSIQSGSSEYYALYVLLTDGTEQKLAGWINQSDHALYIEQEIERFLGIEDQPVSGEYGNYVYDV